jgi:hypothetical protein
MAAKTTIRKPGRPKKKPEGEKKFLEPPYSKEAVLKAISLSDGFLLGVQEVLKCSAPTASEYIKKWPETQLAFEIAKIPPKKLCLQRYMQALDDGERWAIDRMLRQMPEEGLSPDKPDKKESQEQNQIIGFEVVPYDEED